MSNNPQNVAKILAGIHELKDLSQSQLNLISNTEIHLWGPEEYIIHEGAGALNQMIVILSGEVRIRKRVRNKEGESYEQLNEMNCPTLVGENSFFTGFKCSAGVYAKGRSTGIIIKREHLVDLIKLDKLSVTSFLRNIISESLRRGQSTESLYNKALRMILPNENISIPHPMLAKFNSRMENQRIDVQSLRDLLLETLMFIRGINKDLERLYDFANLRKIRIVSVDSKPIGIPVDHRFYRMFQKIKKEILQAQDIVPLEMIDFNNMLLETVTSEFFQDQLIVDYPAIVAKAAQAHADFVKLHKVLGVEI